jgi:DNA-binding protein H-NS
MIDLSKLSFEELKNLQYQVAKEIPRRQQEEVEKARRQIREIAESAGLSLNEVINMPLRNVRKGQPVAVKFRNPNNSMQQWSGRGRQPGWVRDWLAAGRPLDALKVA